MSVKVNGVVEFAAVQSTTVYGKPVVESLVNDLVVTNARVVEVDKGGHAILFVEVPNSGGGVEFRPVADSVGNAKQFASLASALGSVKRGAPNANVDVFPFIRAASVGDPIKTLISKHKAAKTEAAKAQQATDDVAALVSAADALEWDQAAANSAEKVEWDDLQDRTASVSEWKTKVDALVTGYTANLVAANIDPVTYLHT